MNEPGERIAQREVPIAVVGLATLMPGSLDVGEFWQNIVSGRDLVTDVPASHWLVDDYYDPDPAAPDKTYCRRGAFLPEVPFDPIHHSIPPNLMEATDPAQLLGLVVADALLTDVRQNLAAPVDRERTGVILGNGGLSMMGVMDSRLQRPIWLNALRESGVPESQAQQICERISAGFVPWQEASFPGLLSNVITGRIANRLDLHGVNCTVDAACGGSLAAVSAAVNELSLGRADLMFTGGVDALNSPLMYVCFSKTPALSATGDCRPFSADADGTLLGEGLGMVALKRLADAELAGDRIYSVIRGVGSSSDGRGTAIYAPAASGQARALHRAYAGAGYGPDTVELVEAHGTGTKMGDAAEFAALREVFEEDDPDSRGWCALGSIKSQIGHTKSAAGAAGLIKAVLSLHNKVLPPTIKADRANPAFDIDTSPFYLNTRARPWTRGPDHPRRASVSSFGFGGSNFHVTLEEYRPGTNGRRAQRHRARPSELMLVGADTPDELAHRGRALLEAGSAADVARASQAAFDPVSSLRLAVVGGGTSELGRQFEQALSTVTRHPDRSFAVGTTSYATEPAVGGPVAFVFPGQGSQYPGMGADVAMAFEAAQKVWDETASMSLGDLPLHRVVFPAPTSDPAARQTQQRTLTDTRWAQPALAAHSLALLAVLAELGVKPQCVAGHSVGELVALCAADVLSRADLLRLARARGEFMAATTDVPGDMLSITADRAEVMTAIAASGSTELWPANFNRPRQTVVSGTRHAIAELESRLSARGIATRRLDVHSGFHSPLVESAVAPLRSFLEGLDLGVPGIDVYSNVDAQRYSDDAAAIRRQLAAHVAAPVRFVDEVEAMYAAGIRIFVEVGAGSSVTGMITDILGTRHGAAIALDHRDSHGVTALMAGVGRMAVHGVPVDFTPLWDRYRPDSDADPDARAMTIPINGAPYRHRYPPRDRILAEPNPEPPTESPTSDDRKATTSVHPEPQPARSAVTANDPHWLDTVAEAQRYSAEAHAAFQQALLSSHQAYLQMTERTLNRLAEIASSTAPPQTPPATAQFQPDPTAISTLARDFADWGPPPQRPQPSAAAPSLTIPTGPVADPTTRVDLPVPRPDDASVSTDLLLEVLADKTGYPLELLGGDMDLESELGVDSIKKVEILAAVRQRASGLPSADSPEMAELFKLRTLNAIADALRGPTPSARTVASAPAPSPTESLEEADPTEVTALGRFVVRPVPAPACGLSMPGLGSGPIHVVDGGSETADAVVAALNRRGVTAIVADDAPAPVPAVVLLGGLSTAAGPDHAGSLLRQGFRWARAVAPILERDGGVFVTVQDTGGDFGISAADPSRAWFGGFAALARTARQEWPTAAVKAIDIARGGRSVDVIAEAIVTELLAGGPASDVGLATNGARTALTLAEAPPIVAAQPVVDARSVIVVSGGARGVTAACLDHLLRIATPRVVILGRTAVADEPAGLDSAADEPALVSALANRLGEPAAPARLAERAREILTGREVRRNLAQWRDRGAQVRYARVDVTDRAAVGAALREVRRDWGPITGVVHAAGVLADKLIAEKTDDQYERVMATKIDGLRVLLAETAEDPLELLCVFSSVAAQFGNRGQCDYAMANEVLTHVALAQQRTRPNCAVRSIAWGPWKGGMVGAGLADHFAANQVPLIPLTAGAAAFTGELTGPFTATHTLIMAGEPRQWPTAESVKAAVALDAPHLAPLADHVIGGTTVLPVAFAVEWFAALTAAWRAETGTIVITDLAVLRKVEVEAEAVLTVEGKPTDGGLSLRLASAQSAAHYRASAAVVPAIDETAWSTPSGLEPVNQAEIYDGTLLFHGPRLRVLRGPVEVGDGGAAAEIAGVRELGWPGESHWLTDPAAVDGAFQLAVLWGRRVLGTATLPMAVREIRLRRRGPSDAPLRCLLRPGEVTDGRACCDAVLFDAAGAVVIELSGIVLIARPDAVEPRG